MSEEQSLRIAAFTGQLSTQQRAEILKNFAEEDRIDLLICTDAAARGLDLPNVHAVVNYEVPRHLRAYIHRVGRTARAQQVGLAYSIATVSEAHPFKAMLSAAGITPTSIKIPKRFIETHGPKLEAALT